MGWKKGTITNQFNGRKTYYHLGLDEQLHARLKNESIQRQVSMSKLITEGIRLILNQKPEITGVV